jgi:integrase/recombinase XerD
MRPLVFNKHHEKMKDHLFGTNWRTLTGFLNTILKRESCRVLGKELKSHDFRRALGYHLLRAGCSIRHIQSILGHEDIKSTEAYTKVDKEDLKKVFDQYHPRRLKKGK